MKAEDPNLRSLVRVAEGLGSVLRREVVFVGGAVAGLLVTDPAVPAIRATEDVDLLVEVVKRSEYYALEDALRARGFRHDASPGAPICRWRLGSLPVDVMPTDASTLGFSNRWYPLAFETAVSALLPGGHEIRLITAPAFVATKLEAFFARGKGDYLFSHDLEDVLGVVDGRPALVGEVRQAAPALREYVAETFAVLLSVPAFVEALPGHLPPDPASQARLPYLIDRLRSLAYRMT